MNMSYKDTCVENSQFVLCEPQISSIVYSFTKMIFNDTFYKIFSETVDKVSLERFVTI